MMEVDMIERGKLGSDFTAEQGGGERSCPVIIGKNNDVISV